MSQSILVTYEPASKEKEIFQEVLTGLAQVRFLKQESESNRSRLLSAADIIVALSFSQDEIHSDEIPLLHNTRFIQLIYAGADKIPFAHIPDECPLWLWSVRAFILYRSFISFINNDSTWTKPN